MCMEDLCSYDTTMHKDTTMTSTTTTTTTSMSSSSLSSSPHYHSTTTYHISSTSTPKRVTEATKREGHENKEEEDPTIVQYHISHHDNSCDLLPDCMASTSHSSYDFDTNKNNTLAEDDTTAWMMVSSSSTSTTTNHPMTISTDDWGIPGYLTQDEYQIFKKFRTKVYLMDDDFRSTLFSFQTAYEEEEFALCRWLRANKFHLEDTLRHVHHAVELSSEARKYQFYPNPTQDALGVHPSIYMDYYPQYNHGYAKNGSPIFVSKPGILNFPALACITTPEGIIRYHWWLQTHDLGKQFKQSYQRSMIQQQEQQSSSTFHTTSTLSKKTRFRRYETLNIMDLDHLSPSIFSSSKYPLQLIRAKSNIDQVCFPETLDRMIIIDAPVFFTFTWRMIRGFIDPRNANKVELYGKSDWERDKWRARLEELIDTEHIPIEYRNPNSISKDTALPSMDRSDPEYKDVLRRASFFLNVRTDPSTPDLLLEHEAILHVSVYTRSRSGGYIQIYYSSTTNQSSSSKSSKLLHQILVEHKGNGSMEEAPTCIQLTPDHLNGKSLDTPGIYTITVIPSGSKCEGSTMSDDFVIAIRFCSIPKSSPVTMNGTSMNTESKKATKKMEDYELISPNLTYRVRSKGALHLFRTPDDLQNDSLEVQLSIDRSMIKSENRQKKIRQWKLPRYFCGSN